MVERRLQKKSRTIEDTKVKRSFFSLIRIKHRSPLQTLHFITNKCTANLNQIRLHNYCWPQASLPTWFPFLLLKDEEQPWVPSGDNNCIIIGRRTLLWFWCDDALRFRFIAPDLTLTLSCSFWRKRTIIADWTLLSLVFWQPILRGKKVIFRDISLLFLIQNSNTNIWTRNSSKNKILKPCSNYSHNFLCHLVQMKT